MLRQLYILLFTLISNEIAAQTMTWSIFPADYSGISLIAKDTYKVEQGSKVGLITSSGEVLMPLLDCEMGGFYDGYALVTYPEDSRHAILGVMTSDYKYIPFSERYYTIDEMDFVSNGMIPVTNSRGRAGYINVSGDAVVGFNGKYKMVTPFSEGYASVSTNGETYNLLIDKNGNPCSIDLGFQVVGGFFNVFNGNATVYDADGNYYRYNVKTRQVNKAPYPGSPSMDYLCCLKEQSNRGETIPFRGVNYKAIKTLTPIKGNNGFYGYNTEDGRIVLPPQFTYASDVMDGHAIVKTSKGFGILAYDNNTSHFSISASKTHHVYTSEKTVNCNFRLNVPSPWKNKSLNVTVTRNGNTIEATPMSDGSYTLSQNPNGLSNAQYDVAVTCDGLQLWNGKQSYTFEKKIIQNLRVALHLINDKADKNDHCNVTATITNPGDESVTCHYSMTGSDTFVSTSGSIVVPAGGSKVVSGHFLIKKAAPKQWVKINITPGGSDMMSGKDLIPFYTGF